MKLSVNTHFSQYIYIYFMIIITTCSGLSVWPSSVEVQNFEVKKCTGYKQLILGKI
jgi:hypothetical protein